MAKKQTPPKPIVKEPDDKKPAPLSSFLPTQKTVPNIPDKKAPKD